MSNNNGNSQTGARGLSGNGNVPGPNNVKTYNVPNSSKISTWTLSSPFLRRRSIPEKQLVALIQAYKSTNNKNANAKNAYMKLIKSEINKWGTGVPVAPVSVPRRSLRNVFRLRAAAPPAPAAAPANAPAAWARAAASPAMRCPHVRHRSVMTASAVNAWRLRASRATAAVLGRRAASDWNPRERCLHTGSECRS